ncbi:MAG: hypothetical protein A2W99_15640 [Bacteroidetes bacterium GWF2_33_16]|nr:MAG: hypothetical protein A2X00_14985 [Bacteroidetes bacterium GWE2_32_14]OFY02341.1 MAG: hypothetical protein A2W99_15640 [Bacteroidetes bacterium GWF2_33_16]
MKCSDRKCYVFYTYPKFERKVHECLLKDGFDSFLPMHWIVRQWSDRKKKLLVPMFPNYIFANIEYSHIWEILKNSKVICCVKFNNQPSFLKQKEIDNIVKIINNDYLFEISCNLSIGDSVIINGGALTGMKGVLVEERGKKRFALRIESLKQSIIVNVPSEYLECKDRVHIL